MSAVADAVAVPYVNLGLQHEAIKTELLEAVGRVLSRGDFILGEDVAAFEAEFAAYTGVKYAISVANGTDALMLALRALGIGKGDEVITAPNSYLASASSVALVGATPVFVDVRDDYNIDPDLIERAITPRTKAIIPVHLTGRPADMRPIMAVAQQHNLTVIEDVAQAVGAKYDGQMVGSFGIGCFSLHPLKTLNAAGDGGVVTTNDENIYRWLIKARNHGLRSRDECEFWSLNSRLDTVQAAMLRVKMKYLDGWIAARRANAAYYQQQLGDVVQVPRDKSNEFAVYHTFIVQADRRDDLQRYLKDHRIGANIHYPIPIHLQEAARGLGYKAGDFPVTERQSQRILSLPIYPELTDAQKQAVVAAIWAFYNHNAR